MKVENMTSSNGNKVANQFIIKDRENDIVYFQSYNTIIVKKVWGKPEIGRRGETYLDKRHWDYSVTTGKYRNIFLGETKKETEKKIANGEYILADLNG